MTHQWLGVLFITIYVLGHIARAGFWFEEGARRFWRTHGRLAGISKAALVGAIIVAPITSIETAMPTASILSMSFFIAHLATMGAMGRVDAR